MQYHPEYGISVEERNWVPSPQYLLRRDRILKHLKNRSHLKILEIGCGSGALLYDLSKLGHECTAVEISPQALELASYINNDEDNTVIFSSLDEVDFGSFDIVIACEVLEHIEDDIYTFKNWTRYLKQGGEIIISVPAHPRKWDATDDWAGHYRRYTRTRFDTLVQSSNCTTRKVECYAFPFTNIIAPIRAYFLKKESSLTLRKTNSQSDKELNTLRSGTSRSLHKKFYPLQISPIGKLIMKVNFYLQEKFIQREFGLCYILVAQKPIDKSE